MLVLAHRGDHRAAPENSLAAFAAAFAVPGCDGVELDVRQSADGEAVVIHDATLAGVQGRPDRVAGLTASELRALGVPTLADVFAALPPHAFVDVELKGAADAAAAGIAAAAAGVAAAARGAEFRRTAVSSFDLAILAAVFGLAPHWPRWLITTDPRDVETARTPGCQGLAVEWGALSPGLMQMAHDAGLQLIAWTLRSTADRLRVEGMGVDAICAEGDALGG